MSNLFGTDGIRGAIGIFPFTVEDTIRLGKALGEWIGDTYGTNAHVLMVQDTRESADWFSHTLGTGLLMHPLTIHHAGVLPTPAVSHLLAGNSHFDCGIILSASHNPFQDNGIKIIDRKAGKINQDQEISISNKYHRNRPSTYNQFGTTCTFKDAAQLYTETITARFQTLSLKGKTIVLDCAHGAVHAVAPAIFSALGARVITMHNAPNGRNINEDCGALHPLSVQKAVIQYKADLGCAFDGDGDRVILVNQDGEIKNGDDMLALLSNHPHYTKQSVLVGTVMSNQGLEHYLSLQNKQLLRTPVGDRWIAQKLNEQNFLLGGEQSGHIILHDVLSTGDGIATALRVLESIVHTDNWSMQTFDSYPQKLINVPIVHKKDLKEPAIAAIIAEYQKQLDSGRLHVRYSGTENLLRVMVEDRETDATHRICSHLAQALEKELQ